MTDDTATAPLSRDLADYADEDIVFGKVPGLVYQRALIAGRIAGQAFNTLLGIQVTAVDEAGVSVSVAQPTPQFANGGGPLHGGYLSALMDCATATSVHSMLPEGVGAPHIHASYRFIEAGNPTRTLDVRARVTHFGRQILHAAAEVFDDRGHLLASGETIHKVRSIRSRPVD